MVKSAASVQTRYGMSGFNAVCPDSRPEATAVAVESDAAVANAPAIALELPPCVQQRVAMIQSLIQAQGSDRYGAMQQQAAQTLGLSIRSVQRLMNAWREQGLVGFCPHRINADWQR